MSIQNHPRAPWRRAMAGLAAVVVTAGAVIGVTTPAAEAATSTYQDGVCDSGEVCIYYHQNFKGSIADLPATVLDYSPPGETCYKFKTKGEDGYGTCVKKDAASVWNRASAAVRIYTDTNYTGYYQNISANQKVNLNSTVRNKNHSHGWAIGRLAPTAQNGVCEEGEFCLYYHADFKGSVADMPATVANYSPSGSTCYKFKTVGLDGYGTCVKKDAASVWNRTGETITIYTATNFTGSLESVRPDVQKNLTTVKNKNQSHKLTQLCDPGM